MLQKKLFLSSMILFVLTFSLVVSVEASSTMWTQTYGGTRSDWATALITTSDGGYALAGYTYSFATRYTDFWLVKTDASGNMEWNKAYGKTDYDWPFSVVETTDGGYAMAGRTHRHDERNIDYWLVKTDAFGNMQWNKTYDVGTQTETDLYLSDRSLVATSDGGYVLVCYTNSSGAGGDDFLLIKTDASGNIEWSKTYGGRCDDRAYSVVEGSDGGYAIAGETNCTGYFSGSGNFWLVKTDKFGNMEWNQTYERIQPEYAFVIPAFSLVATSDEGYAIAGATGVSGGSDVLLIKTDASGNMAWNKTYAGPDIDWANSLVATSDGGYAIAGNTQSSGAGYFDFWLIKTDEFGNMEWKKTCGGADDDRAYSVAEASDGGYAVAGFTRSFGVDGYYDFWLVKTDGYVCPNEYDTYEYEYDLGYFTYTVVVWTNSTLGNFDFGSDENRISFSVTGPNGTTGFCKIAIPEELVGDDFPVYLSDTLLVEGADYIRTYNGTHTILDITYSHSTHTLEITGTNIVPEYQSWILSSLLLATAMLFAVNKKKLFAKRS